MMMLLVTVCKILILMAITYSSSCHGKEKETSQWSRKDGTDEKANSPWIDPDTPDDVRTIFSYPVLNISEDTKRGFDLVFSDEFEVDGRTMNDGRDPRWTALHSDDLTNNPLHWYSHDAVTTHDGVLDIKLDVHPETFTYWQQAENVTREQESLNKTHHSVNVTKEFRSGMMQSWNKFCFTGGIIEMSAKLPGDSKTGGLWPAMWMMGNLGRATYLDTSDHMWPFSTNVCDERTKYSQEISACNDNPGYGMQPNRGRGAPEIDFFEVMNMDVLPAPLLSASLQIAPGKSKKRPFLGQLPNVSWYDPHTANGGSLNLFYFGTQTWDPNKTVTYQTDSVSVNFWLDESFYEKQHTFRIEWEPPHEYIEDGPSKNSRGGYIKWFIDGKLISAVVGDDLEKVSQTEVPSEPMSLLLNQALSKDWGFPDPYFLGCPKKCWSCIDPECVCDMPTNFCDKNVPASFEIDYVRVYQVKDEHRHVLGCSPPHRPTKEWIEGHKERYTLWGSPEGTEPLKKIQRGGASCTNLTCGGETRGYCDEAKGCMCMIGWTGPSCLLSYSAATTDMYAEAYPPPAPTMSFKSIFFVVVGITLAGGIFSVHRKNTMKKHEYESLY